MAVPGTPTVPTDTTSDRRIKNAYCDPSAAPLYVSLAQPVEHLPFKEGAVGSNPTGDTTFRV